MKGTNVLLMIIFETSSQPYLKLVIVSMIRNTLIKHKEIVVICEESRLVIANHHTLITQPKSKLVAQHVVTYTIARQQLTCSNYGKIGHVEKPRHNKKKEEPTIPIVPIKVIELVAKVFTQPAKLARMPLRYPCIICFNFEHHALNCPRKVEVHNMFRTKPITIAIVVAKTPKPDNVLVNVVVVFTTCSQVLK
jgi:hypothetical protein